MSNCKCSCRCLRRVTGNRSCHYTNTQLGTVHCLRYRASVFDIQDVSGFGLIILTGSGHCVTLSWRKVTEIICLFHHVCPFLLMWGFDNPRTAKWILKFVIPILQLLTNIESTVQVFRGVTLPLSNLGRASVSWHSGVTSAKSPIILNDNLPQSHDCSSYVSGRILAPTQL